MYSAAQGNYEPSSQNGYAPSTSYDHKTVGGSVTAVPREDIFIHPTSLEQALREAEHLVGYIEAKYKEFKLEEAYRKLKQCQALGDKLNSEEKTRFDQYLSQHEKLFQTIISEYDYLHEIIKELGTNEGWNTDNSSDSFKVMYKKVPNTNLITVRMESEIDIPLFNIIALINEIDLWNLWVPFVKTTSQIKEIHKGSKVYYVEFGLPYPLANRDMHVFGYGINRLEENGSVMIAAKTIDQDYEFQAKNNIKKVEKPSSAQMEIKLGGFEVKVLGPNKSRFTGIANVNPNFNWLPESLINFVLRKGVKFIFDRMLSHAKVFKGSPWEKEAMKEHKQEFYAWLRKEADSYFEKEQKKANLNEKVELLVRRDGASAEQRL